jgi:hypothetical protein
MTRDSADACTGTIALCAASSSVDSRLFVVDRSVT